MRGGERGSELQGSCWTGLLRAGMPCAVTTTNTGQISLRQMTVGGKWGGCKWLRLERQHCRSHPFCLQKWLSVVYVVAAGYLLFINVKWVPCYYAWMVSRSACGGWGALEAGNWKRCPRSGQMEAGRERSGEGSRRKEAKGRTLQEGQRRKTRKWRRKAGAGEPADMAALGGAG